MVETVQISSSDSSSFRPLKRLKKAKMQQSIDD